MPLLAVCVQAAILIWVYPYETPKYHLLKGEVEEARTLIQKIYLDQFIEEVLKEKIQDVDSSIKQRLSRN